MEETCVVFWVRQEDPRDTWELQKRQFVSRADSTMWQWKKTELPEIKRFEMRKTYGTS